MNKATKAIQGAGHFITRATIVISLAVAALTVAIPMAVAGLAITYKIAGPGYEMAGAWSGVAFTLAGVVFIGIERIIFERDYLTNK